ncbi:MAG: nucleotidyltransferase domain-containing protein [Selenomonadaceae bacterium]|nr:nucleotidyltransferase domain-containing protein [Selenomonadaceae bacterium]
MHASDVSAVFVCAALVKKVPQIIYRQKVAVFGSFRRDKFLEGFDIWVSILYEIKNTPLI